MEKMSLTEEEKKLSIQLRMKMIGIKHVIKLKKEEMANTQVI